MLKVPIRLTLITCWYVSSDPGGARGSAHRQDHRLHTARGGPRERDSDIHTIRHGRQPANRPEGNERVSNTAPAKGKAQARGREMAIDRGVEHLLRDADGRIRERNTYPRSRDRRRSRGRRTRRLGCE
jgi:hypothetical protein